MDNKWIDVKDRKPDKELEEWRKKVGGFSPVAVIGVCESWTIPWVVYYDGEDFWEEKCMYSINEIITHWMPLPKSPYNKNTLKG